MLKVGLVLFAGILAIVQGQATYGQECSFDEYTCLNGGCVSEYDVCDGNQDCDDGSDESECPSCTSYQWSCSNGHCILSSWRCDGDRDCTDGSDELNCLNVVGIAVGASTAAFVLFVVVPIIICVVIGCCVANHRPTRTTYVATAAPRTTATVVSATSTQQHYTPYYPAPGTYPAKPNAPPPYPTGYEPPPTYPA